jgi:hypothetical protein
MTQPFRAGLTFSGRPSGPRWVWSKSQSFHPQMGRLTLIQTIIAIRFGAVPSPAEARRIRLLIFVR